MTDKPNYRSIRAVRPFSRAIAADWRSIGARMRVAFLAGENFPTASCDAILHFGDKGASRCFCNVAVSLKSKSRRVLTVPDDEPSSLRRALPHGAFRTTRSGVSARPETTE